MLRGYLYCPFSNLKIKRRGRGLSLQTEVITLSVPEWEPSGRWEWGAGLPLKGIFEANILKRVLVSTRSWAKAIWPARSHRVTPMSLCLWKVRGPGSQEGAVGVANRWCFTSRRIPGLSWESSRLLEINRQRDKAHWLRLTHLLNSDFCMDVTPWEPQAEIQYVYLKYAEPCYWLNCVPLPPPLHQPIHMLKS